MSGVIIVSFLDTVAIVDRGGGRGVTPWSSWCGGVPPRSPNPDPISDLKMSFFTPIFRPGL